MILHELDVDRESFERWTGWQIKPEGACKGDRCVPLPDDAVRDGVVDVRVVAERLNAPLVRDEAHELWAMGPESGGRALTTAQAPDLVLLDINSEPFWLRSLEGQKVLLLAWASW